MADAFETQGEVSGKSSLKKSDPKDSLALSYNPSQIDKLSNSENNVANTVNEERTCNNIGEVRKVEKIVHSGAGNNCDINMEIGTPDDSNKNLKESLKHQCEAGEQLNESSESELNQQLKYSCKGQLSESDENLEEIPEDLVDKSDELPNESSRALKSKSPSQNRSEVVLDSILSMSEDISARKRCIESNCVLEDVKKLKTEDRKLIRDKGKYKIL